VTTILMLSSTALILASFGLQGIVLAQEDDQVKRLLQVGQFRGLLDATCFYYQEGHLDEKSAMAYLRELRNDVDSSFPDGKLFSVLRNQVVREFPACRRVWPE